MLLARKQPLESSATPTAVKSCGEEYGLRTRIRQGDKKNSVANRPPRISIHKPPPSRCWTIPRLLRNTRPRAKTLLEVTQWRRPQPSQTTR